MSLAERTADTAEIASSRLRYVKLILARDYTREHGEDDPAIAGWTLPVRPEVRRG
ncbi:hypothetical protein [Pseudonocardia charpentierae]|uniref:Uncharacterized protein n=1 Tax=Pseudonocardia charpentierae TaxID=3075545 RepID=A0ABU2NFX6_9PSEU|nr:hypothetical protein [Pseudonocardia sp. DSM 45834]MDT0352865.1 hypothetical protein [Pseudonocardia sp. DSM 45834]